MLAYLGNYSHITSAFCTLSEQIGSARQMRSRISSMPAPKALAVYSQRVLYVIGSTTYMKERHSIGTFDKCRNPILKFQYDTSKFDTALPRVVLNAMLDVHG
jgi:hypothetical protein